MLHYKPLIYVRKLGVKSCVRLYKSYPETLEKYYEEEMLVVDICMIVSDDIFIMNFGSIYDVFWI